MALSGSLKEFALPDIFQLIGQQQKSGKLRLTDQGREGFIIFSNGFIIDAGTNSENLITILVNYLLVHKGHPKKKITEFVNYCKGNTKILCDVLRRIQYVSDDELYTLVQLSLEDLACGLFTWTKGNYLFSPIANTADYCVENISFSGDAIAMEAMRRLDEWQRMSETIQDVSVFVAAENVKSLSSPGTRSPIEDPESYLISLLDGSTSVGELCQKTFFTTYKVYETLFTAQQKGRISQVSADKVRAFMKEERERKRVARETTQTTAAILITATVVILLFFSGLIFLPHVIFRSKTRTAKENMLIVPIQQAIRQTRISKLFYTAQTGKTAENLLELEKNDYIDNKTRKILKRSKIVLRDIK